MLRNAFRTLQDLVGNPPLQVGTVTAVTDGVATITLPGGGQIQARGNAAVASVVYVQGGVIQGPAPTLPTEVILI